jgi:ribosomal protein L11 methylase PrmA
MDGRLYEELTAAGLMVEHEEVSLSRAFGDEAYRVIRPRQVPFISYPYEWPFSALKEAALLTLEIQRRALQAGMVLKDASSYNVQFEGTRPIFIDTLSFEKYLPGKPWTAYNQFCRHFLAPLALMAKTDIELNRLLSLHMDGIPLELAAKLLPWSARLRFGLLLHICLQARMVKRYSDTSKESSARPPGKERRVSLQGLTAIVESLRKTVSNLTWDARGTEWADYYQNTSYTSAAFEEKKQLVEAFLRQLQPRTVWDLGANTGVFSRIACQIGARTYAFDVDPACVEILFKDCSDKQEKTLLPLCIDLANPSPAVGWAHRERHSLAERGPADVVMALALIHHLAISNNLPFTRIAEFFRRLCQFLIIEFVPKSDPQVKRLLRSREDVFHDYDQRSFEKGFEPDFAIAESRAVGEDGRVLYLMKARNQSGA